MYYYKYHLLFFGKNRTEVNRIKLAKEPFRVIFIAFLAVPTELSTNYELS